MAPVQRFSLRTGEHDVVQRTVLSPVEIRRARALIMAHLRRTGMSAEQIAYLLHCTPRHVYRCLARVPSRVKQDLS